MKKTQLVFWGMLTTIFSGCVLLESEPINHRPEISIRDYHSRRYSGNDEDEKIKKFLNKGTVSLDSASRRPVN